MPVDILADQVQDLMPQLGLAVEVLQRPQNGNDLVPTTRVQFDFHNRRACQTQLGIHWDAHPCSSTKIGGTPARNLGIPDSCVQ